jgi:cob(I)alamin adenosyltransferase
MSITTKRGDRGETDLLFGKRIAKTSLRVEALGSVDELNSALGLARASGLSAATSAIVDAIQERLIALMGQLACLPQDEARYAEKGYAAIREEDLAWLEAQITRIESEQGLSRGWSRPGAIGSPGLAALNLACAIARRAERTVLALHQSGEPVPECIRQCFNRLSDLIWLLARGD